MRQRARPDLWELGAGDGPWPPDPILAPYSRLYSRLTANRRVYPLAAGPASVTTARAEHFAGGATPHGVPGSSSTKSSQWASIESPWLLSQHTRFPAV